MRPPVPPRIELQLAQPEAFQEFPEGADVEVRGAVRNAGGGAGNPVRLVSVQIDGGAAEEATLVPPTTPGGPTAFRAVVKIPGPGAHRLTVTAAGSNFGFASRSLTLATAGTAYCSPEVAWENYPRTQSLVPQFTCSPRSLAGLVGAVQEAERLGKRVHAFGSKWSFSDCAITGDHVVDTVHLIREIQTVQMALRPNLAFPVYHVEAGMSVKAVYDGLERNDLALETMGGAAEQTLAGAISTGTHGGDKHLAPLADSVLAIHLVGPGGRQYWIEPTNAITDRKLLTQHVAHEVDPLNIVYDDETFNACLVSLGCMGVIYALVLRARQRYDLAESTVGMPWAAFLDGAAELLRDRDVRFVQVLLDPYLGPTGNACLLTTRTEDAPTVPAERKPGPVELLAGLMVAKIILENPLALPLLLASGVTEGSTEEQMTKLVNAVLEHAPGQRHILTESYGSIMAASMPPGDLRGLSYSVMDLGFTVPRRASNPGYSIEISFPAFRANGELGFVDFVNDLIGLVNASVDTFFTGYMSLRFSGATRAHLGMQQWEQTCSMEIAIMQGVRGLHALLGRLYALGLQHGGLPHWGQMLDFDPAVRGHGRLYRGYDQWRAVYGRLSNNFRDRTFENALSVRWRLTTPPFAAQRLAVAPLPDRRLQLWATDGNGGVSSTWKLSTAASSAWAFWTDFLGEVGPVNTGAQQLAAAPLPDGRLQLWVADGGGGLQSTWKKSADPNADWSGWADFLSEVGAVSGGVTQVAAAPLPDGRLELWAVDRTGGLLTTWKETTDPDANWTAWSDFLHETGPVPEGVHQVAVATLPDGRLELWVVDKRGGIRTSWKTTPDPDATWSQWSDFIAEVGAVTGGVLQVAVAPLSDGRLQLFAVAGGGGLVTTWKENVDPNGNWTGWSDVSNETGPLPAAAVDVAAGVLADGSLQIWASTAQGSLRSSWKTSPDPDAAWTAWADFLAEV